MYERLITSRILAALSEVPVVLIVGPRRAGKTTLVRHIARHQRPYFTLDDKAVLDFARNDPEGFVREINIAVIDEVQRAPDLMLAIKRSVDEDGRYGRFLLTGSANILTLPRLADSLAGRMRVISLYPLARCEIIGTASTFLQRLFHQDLQPSQVVITGSDLIQTALVGGFPESLICTQETQRHNWMRDYLTATVMRDLRDISHIQRLAELPRFLRYLAEYSGKVVNYSEFGGSIDVSYQTSKHYVHLLQQVFFITLLPPWSTNKIKRLVKKPKIHFLDSGLLATARGETFSSVKGERSTWGSLLESFVVSEVLKLIHASDMWLIPYHFRQNNAREVDLLLERSDGKVVGIEIKARATVGPRDFKGLQLLQQALGERFAAGVVLCDREDIVPYSKQLVAAPISCLWE